MGLLEKIVSGVTATAMALTIGVASAYAKIDEDSIENKTPVISNQTQSQSIIWHEASPMQGTRSGFGGVSDREGNIYAIGGLRGLGSSNVLSSVEKYDPQTDQWSFSKPMPQPRYHLKAERIADNIYVAGGLVLKDGHGIPTDTVIKYDINNNQWSNLSPMNHIRGLYGICSDSNGFLYVVGGSGDEERLSSVERYDPKTDQWSVMPPMNLARSLLASFCYDDFIYAVGGATTNRETNEVERLNLNDLSSGWKKMAPLSEKKQIQGALGLDGLFYVAGGWKPGYTNKVEAYNPQTNTWEQKSSLNRSSNNMALVSSGNRIYVLGGDNSNRVEYAEILEVNTPTFTNTPTPSFTNTFIPTPEKIRESPTITPTPTPTKTKPIKTITPKITISIHPYIPLSTPTFTNTPTSTKPFTPIWTPTFTETNTNTPTVTPTSTIPQKKLPIKIFFSEDLLTKEADFNKDNLVNHLDLLMLQENWQNNNSEFDLNKDGIVNDKDLLRFIELYHN